MGLFNTLTKVSSWENESINTGWLQIFAQTMANPPSVFGNTCLDEFAKTN